MTDDSLHTMEDKWMPDKANNERRGALLLPSPVLQNGNRVFVVCPYTHDSLRASVSVRIGSVSVEKAVQAAVAIV